MILTRKIEIKKKGCSNLKKYKDLGYNITEDIFEINTEHLSCGSRKIVILECDICKCLKNIIFKDYIRFNIFPFFECSNCKRKKTNLEKYGVEYTSKLEEVKNKKEKTNLEKYGSISATQNKDVISKIKKTNLDRYGVENVFQSNEIKEKCRKTNLEKYGNIIYSKTDEYIDKIKKTNNLLYGADYYTQTDTYRSRFKKTNLEKYGVEHHMHSIVVKNKIKKTNLKKYGVNHFYQFEDFRKKFKIVNDPNYIKYLNNSISVFQCDLGNGHTFEISYDNYSKRIDKDIPLCTICNNIKKSSSIIETELYEFIKSVYKGNIINSYRDKQEIDIYLPELNLGFEFNGLYWHSDLFKEKRYHLNKTNYFKTKNIDIIHIWEDDWMNHKEIVKSSIKRKLNLLRIIDSNDCIINEINKRDSKFFLIENNLEKVNRSTIYIGLFYNNELVYINSFIRVNKKWILNLFCEKKDIKVSYGLEKSIEYFIKNYLPQNLSININNDWHNEKILENLTINLDRISITQKLYDNFKVYNSGSSIYKINI